MKVDYLIVGSGLTGAVIARMLADAGRDVLVVERRAQVGGNVADAVHEASGIRYNLFGPHYFRTSSERIWSFVQRFADFFPFEARVKTLVDGRAECWPPNEEFLCRKVGKNWRHQVSNRQEWGNFEEAAFSLIPRVILDKVVRGYSEKQWGVTCDQLSPDLCKRFDVRQGCEDRLTPHAKFQGLPREGYSAWMREMLRGIPCCVNWDYLEKRGSLGWKHLIFTGPIDAFFGYDLGKLQYRGQQRTHAFEPAAKYVQSCGQINEPRADVSHIRTIEWKWMMHPDDAARVTGSLLTRETPFSPANPDQYEYPFPDEANARLYKEYRKRADALEGVSIEGRLGRNEYLDMDAAIARAMKVAERLLKERP